MIHLRVAERLCEQLQPQHHGAFLLGNMAPDSGLPVDGGSRYVPDKDISHFRFPDATGEKRIHEEVFLSRCFSPEKRAACSADAWAFHYGYLIHLLTDKLWRRDILPLAVQWEPALHAADRGTFWRQVKKDWYDLDFLYLKAHPDFPAYRRYRTYPHPENVYLDFFPPDAFALRRRFILDFYREGVARVVPRPTHLSAGQLDAFVASCARELPECCGFLADEIKARGL